MNRRSFLGRAGATVAGLVVAPRVTLENAAGPPEVAAAPALADTSLIASGGLCAPVLPYYALNMVNLRDRPVRSALAERGNV